MTEMEIDILASLQHPAIIQIYDACDYGNKLYCFMELIQGGQKNYSTELVLFNLLKYR